MPSPASPSVAAEGLSLAGSRSPRSVAAVFALLTLLAFGLFAPDRGLHDDDVAFLAGAQARLERGPGSLLEAPKLTPTRKLPLLAFAAASLSGSPRLFLQLLLGAVWMAQGCVVYAIARELFPGRPRLAFLAGALALVSTGDTYAFSAGSLHYQSSTLACFGALLCALRYYRLGGALSLVGVPLLLTVSFWLIDAGLTTFLLAPLLLWVHAGYRWPRRLLWVSLAALAAFVPYAVAFARFMLDAESYASYGTLDLEPGEWIARGASLFAYNFTPWEWFARPQRFSGWVPGAVIPHWLRAVAALVGSLAFLWWAQREAAASGPAGPPGARHHFPSLLASFVVMAAASNAMYAVARLSQFHYRTQLVSRLWVALLLAALLDRWMRGATTGDGGRRGLAARWLASGLAALFVFFGILGGMERQNFYLASWLLQRQELASIVAEAPTLRADAYLILRVPNNVYGLATQDTEFARNWARLLYRDPTLVRRVFVVSKRGGGCAPEPGALRCWHERLKNKTLRRARRPDWEAVIPLHRAVVMTYRPREGRYRLAESLPRSLAGAAGDAPGTYAPRALVVARPPGDDLGDLLGGGNLLARFLPRP